MDQVVVRTTQFAMPYGMDNLDNSVFADIERCIVIIPILVCITEKNIQRFRVKIGDLWSILIIDLIRNLC